MLRASQAAAATAARASRASGLRIRVDHARRLATASAIHQAKSVAEILSSAHRAQPLKDAVKFYVDGADPTIWSYRDLDSNVSALSSGMQALGYGPGDKVVAWLPTGSPEYAVLILAAANVGATVVSVAPPEDPNNASVVAVSDAVRAHAPRMLLFAYEFGVAEAVADDGIVAATHPVLNAIAPGVSVADARGTSGFSPLSGKPFECESFPSLHHVVHTGDKNVRGSITFKSILAYNGAYAPVAASTKAVVLSADDGKGISGVEAISEAAALGAKLELNNDHTSQKGKLIIAPSTAPSAATGMIAAVMHEALWISPGSSDKLDSVAENENAVVLQ